MMRYREPRYPCRRRASLRIGVNTDSQPVDLVNISPRGARVVGVTGLAPGMVVLLSVPPLQTLRGVIQWCDGGQAGLRFAAPLGTRVLALLRLSTGAAPLAPRPGGKAAGAAP